MVSAVAITTDTLSLDDSLEEDHFVTPCILATRGIQIPTRSLIDCGATAYAFLDLTFAQKNNIDLFPLKEARELTVVDGRPISSGPITHLAIAALRLGSHQESNVPFFVTALKDYPVVLGLPWMRRHRIQFDWSNDSLRFTSELCANHCMSPSASSYIHQVPELSQPEKPSRVTQQPKQSQSSTEKPSRVTQQPKQSQFSTGAHAVAAASLINIEKALAPKQFVDPASKLPLEYHEFLDVFSRQESDKLPPN